MPPMSDAVLIALITMVGALLTTALGVVNTLLMKKLAKDGEETKEAVATLEKNTNSIKDALVKVTGEAQHAAGKLEGAKEEREKAMG